MCKRANQPDRLFAYLHSLAKLSTESLITTVKTVESIEKYKNTNYKDTFWWPSLGWLARPLGAPG